MVRDGKGVQDRISMPPERERGDDFRRGRRCELEGYIQEDARE